MTCRGLDGCVPWPSTPLLLGVIALCLLVAVDVSTTGMQAARRAVVVALVGMSAVLVVPSVASAWLIMLLSGFQAVLTTGMITTVTSPAQTFNASFVSAVPEEQARFDLLNVADSVVAEGIVEDIRGGLGIPRRLRLHPSGGAHHDAGRPTMRDGPVVVVKTTQQVADMLGVGALDAAAHAALQHGAAVRSGGPRTEDSASKTRTPPNQGR